MRCHNSSTCAESKSKMCDNRPLARHGLSRRPVHFSARFFLVPLQGIFRYSFGSGGFSMIGKAPGCGCGKPDGPLSALGRGTD